MAGNIITACITIQGVRPILWHRFGPEAIPLQKQEKTGVAGNDPEEWRKTVLVAKDGQLYVEPSYIFGTLRDGARYTKRGRGSAQSHLVATLQVVDDRIYFDRFIPGMVDGKLPDVLTGDPDAPVYLDVRSVKNPTTKARNVRYRVAASQGWRSTFRITWDKTVISRNEMESIVLDAGKLVGLGDARSIGFGRFDLVSFVIVEE